jgi:hypothetical protein
VRVMTFGPSPRVCASLQRGAARTHRRAHAPHHTPTCAHSIDVRVHVHSSVFKLTAVGRIALECMHPQMSVDLGSPRLAAASRTAGSPLQSTTPIESHRDLLLDFRFSHDMQQLQAALEQMQTHITRALEYARAQLQTERAEQRAAEDERTGDRRRHDQEWSEDRSNGIGQLKCTWYRAVKGFVRVASSIVEVRSPRVRCARHAIQGLSV